MVENEENDELQKNEVQKIPLAKPKLMGVESEIVMLFRIQNYQKDIPIKFLRDSIIQVMTIITSRL